MARDRSLDEFFGGGTDGSTASDTDGDAGGDSGEPEAGTDGAEMTTDTDDAEVATDTDGSDDHEPAAVTYRWNPDGVRCSDCGATAHQLWSGESGQVCAACKEW